jgi:hypothetical protein
MTEMQNKVYDRVFACLSTKYSIGRFTLTFDTPDEAEYAKHVGQNFDPISFQKDGKWVVVFAPNNEDYFCYAEDPTMKSDYYDKREKKRSMQRKVERLLRIAGA